MQATIHIGKTNTPTKGQGNFVVDKKLPIDDEDTASITGLSKILGAKRNKNKCERS